MRIFRIGEHGKQAGSGKRGDIIPNRYLFIRKQRSETVFAVFIIFNKTYGILIPKIFCLSRAHHFNTAHGTVLRCKISVNNLSFRINSVPFSIENKRIDQIHYR